MLIQPSRESCRRTQRNAAERPAPRQAIDVSARKREADDRGRDRGERRALSEVLVPRQNTIAGTGSPAADTEHASGKAAANR
jgi:hypothetical protein